MYTVRKLLCYTTHVIVDVGHPWIHNGSFAVVIDVLLFLPTQKHVSSDFLGIVIYCCLFSSFLFVHFLSFFLSFFVFHISFLKIKICKRKKNSSSYSQGKKYCRVKRYKFTRFFSKNGVVPFHHENS